MADTTNASTNPRQLTRDLVLETAAADNAARRVPAVLSTEFAVARDGYSEILEHIASAIDLSRAPLPLIEQHAHGKLNIGIVENITLDGHTLRGEVVFGSSARATELWPDIRDGVVRSLSIGYMVHAQRNVGETGRVTRWQPFEVSLVSVPADPGAGLYRSISMSNTSTDAPIRTAHTALDGGMQAERARVTEIRSIAARHLRAVDGGEAVVDAAIADGASVADFQKSVLQHLASIDRAAGGLLNRFDMTSGGGVSGTGGESRNFVAAASDALLMRAGMQIPEPHAAARDFCGMSTLDMARACVHRSGRGVASGDSQRMMVRAAMSTSDFVAILENTLGKALRTGHEVEPATYEAWTRHVLVPDFKPQSRVILGSAPDLLQVAECGEYTYGGMDEDKSVPYSVGKFGRMLKFSWEALINDDLAAFLRVTQAMGQAARRAEADSIYATFAENSFAGPTMQDSVALFHSTHGNITTTAGALDGASLGAARVLLRRQTAVGGGVMNLTPRFLLVSPEDEQAAESLLAAAARGLSQGSSNALVPAWLAQLELVVEARLTGEAAYLLAAPGSVDTFERAWLEADNGPVIEEEDAFATDAKSYKVRHVFGGRWLDWRGAVRVPRS